MNTTYKDIWKKVETIMDVDDYEIPSTLDGRLNLIETGIDIYNEKAYDELSYDRNVEEVGRQLTSNQMAAVANCIKLQTALNMLSNFSSTYSMYQSDIGIRDYKSQVSARQDLVDRQERIVGNLLFAMCEDFGGDE